MTTTRAKPFPDEEVDKLRHDTIEHTIKGNWAIWLNGDSPYGYYPTLDAAAIALAEKVKANG